MNMANRRCTLSLLYGIYNTDRREVDPSARDNYNVCGLVCVYTIVTSLCLNCVNCVLPLISPVLASPVHYRSPSICLII